MSFFSLTRPTNPTQPQDFQIFLESLRNNFLENQENVTLINKIDKVSAAIFAVLNIFGRFYNTLSFFAAGFAIKGILNYYNVQTPPLLAATINKIREIWTREGIPTAACITGIILFLQYPDYVSTGTGLTAGAAAFTPVISTLLNNLDM